MLDPSCPIASGSVIGHVLVAAFGDAGSAADQLHRLGWVVVHSCWQAAAVAAVLAVALRILPRRSTVDVQTRYVVATVALFALPAACVATYAAIPSARQAEAALVAADESFEVERRAEGPSVGRDVPLPGRRGIGPRAAEVGLFLRRTSRAVEPWLAWCGTVWITGFLIAAVRLGVGLSATRRLVAEAIPPADPRWQARLDRWRTALGIGGRLRLLASPRIDVPMVVGWLQPVVVWPLSAVTGMPPDQIDAILVHELAHVRRHDVLVNLLQSVIDMLFFHHPAAWWISAQVRAEREHCADDLAVRILTAGRAGSRLSYARALVALEERRTAATLAVASAGGSLVDRVRRLADVDVGPRRASRQVAAIMLGLVLIAMASLVIAAAPDSDELPGDTNRIESLSPQQAGKLLADFKPPQLAVDIPGIVGAKLPGLQLKGLRSLDAETARALAAFRGGFLALDGLASLSAEAAAAIAGFEGAELSRGNRKVAVISLDGLTSLSADTASALAGFKGMHLSLDGLTTLSAEAAAGCAALPVQYLSLGGLPTISPEAAAALAGFKGRVLALPGLTSLSAEAARPLARSTAWDGSLPKFTTLPADVAAALCESPTRWLRLGGLAEMSGEAAAAIAQGQFRAIDLGLRTLSAEAARGLAGYSAGHLLLNGLTSLTPEAARGIAGFKGMGLSLHRMTSLTADAAEELARSPAWDGCLAAFTELPVDVARAVAKCRAKILCLNGLTSVSPEVAAALAEFEGQELQLNGLESLSDAEAAAFSTFRGGLSIHRVSSLSPAAARVLATSEIRWVHAYQISSRLSQEKNLTPEVAMLAAAIAKGGGGISLEGITAIESPDAVAIAEILTKAKGRLVMPNLRKISPKTLSMLATKEDVEIPLVSTLELIAEPDGSPTDDFVIPEGFEERQDRQARRRPPRR